MSKIRTADQRDAWGRRVPGSPSPKPQVHRPKEKRPADSAARSHQLERWRDRLDREWAQLRAERAELEAQRNQLMRILDALKAREEGRAQGMSRFMSRQPRPSRN